MLKKQTFVKRGGSATIAAERARRGALRLDNDLPGWAEHVDLDRLDMGEVEADSSEQLAAFLVGLDAARRREPLLSDAEVEAAGDEYVAAGVRAIGVTFADYLDHDAFGRLRLRLEAANERCRLAARVASMRRAFPAAPAGVAS